MRNRFDDALAVQSACNLSGVANSLVAHLVQCREEGVDPRTDPAIRMIVYQMAYLTGTADGFDDYGKCSDQCEALSPERRAKAERFEKVAALAAQRFDVDRSNGATFEIDFNYPLAKGSNQAINGTIHLEHDARIEFRSLHLQDGQWLKTGWGFFGDARREAKEYIGQMRDAIASLTGFCGVIAKDDPGLF